ncbi:MAG: CBS domain-containing protein [Burkholderiaceae bacterium]|nr:CBS domain-containing protein [Burkholderiaceae bacterium]
MCANRIRHLPVMHGEELVGMLSVTDVLRALRGIPGT